MDNIKKKELKWLWTKRCILGVGLLVTTSLTLGKLLELGTQWQEQQLVVLSACETGQLLEKCPGQIKMRMLRNYRSQIQSLQLEKQIIQDQLTQSLVSLSILVSTSLVLLSLWFWLQLHKTISLSFTSQFIIFLPEDRVAELGVLQDRLAATHKSTWLIRIILLWCILDLLKASIQINVENLGLPPGRSKRIDE